MKLLVMSGVGACMLLMVAAAAPAAPAAVAASAAPAAAPADVKIAVGHNDLDHATAEFKFKEVPSPAKTSAATKAKFEIVDGAPDGFGGGVEVLHDGKLPTGEDEPSSNFFFNAGTDGGRILIDLGGSIHVKQVNTYSWHTDSRAPQVYTLYAADGAAAGFNAKPGKDVDPVKVGWTQLAKVDTRPKTGDSGGQYGVSISAAQGVLGQFRYFLIAASRTESDDGWGNTFFSEITVIDADAPAAPEDKPAEKPEAEVKPARSAKDIAADWGRASSDLKNVMPSTADLLNPAKREALTPKVLPLLKTKADLLAEMAAAKMQVPGNIANDAIISQACLACLGDADTVKVLETTVTGDDRAAALRARLAQHLAAWWLAAKDEKAQDRILIETQALATASPRDGRLFFVLMAMKDVGAATPALSDQAEGIVADTLKGGDVDFVKQVHAGRAVQKAAMNKPVEFAGKTVDDKDFSTTQYKGKVILIDFWATWCGPCVKELPRVKALYAKYHDQGLEVVGISCDGDGAKLAAYTKQENIPWVQMWEKVQTENDDPWHPIAKKWGILSIPQMFLIDRGGNLRTVEARSNMEEMIPKLLEEKAAEKSAPVGAGR